MPIDFDDETPEGAAPAPEPEHLNTGSILSGYEKPKEIEPEIQPPPLPGDKPIESHPESMGTGDVWRDNPDYYQSGKKQGQKKPGRRLTATVDKNAVTTIPSSYIVTAAMFLMLIDTIIPMVLTGLNNWVSDTKVELENVRLPKEVRKEIEPLGDATLKQLNLTGNPGLMLLLAMSCHYSWNFMLARAKAKNEKLINKGKIKDT